MTSGNFYTNTNVSSKLLFRQCQKIISEKHQALIASVNKAESFEKEM